MTFEIDADEWRSTDDKPALVRYANVIGAKIDGRGNIETIRGAIAAKLGEQLNETGEQLSEPQDETLSLKFGAVKRRIAKQKKYVCVLASTDRDPFPAEAGENGVMFVVPRDQEVILPEGVVTTFKKAIQTKYRWNDEKMRNVPFKVPLYPISVLREATEEDIANEKLQAKGKEALREYNIG